MRVRRVAPDVAFAHPGYACFNGCYGLGYESRPWRRVRFILRAEYEKLAH